MCSTSAFNIYSRSQFIAIQCNFIMFSANYNNYTILSAFYPLYSVRTNRDIRYMLCTKQFTWTGMKNEMLSCPLWLFSRFLQSSYCPNKYTLEKTEGAINNEQSRDIGNIGHTRNKMKTYWQKNPQNRKLNIWATRTHHNTVDEHRRCSRSSSGFL